jgi:inhibitor of KinA
MSSAPSPGRDMRYERPRFLDQGDTALTVEFGDAVDPEINARVLALDAAFRAAGPPGVRETTPTYRSLLVHYEPLEISRAALVAWVEARLPGLVADGTPSLPSPLQGEESGPLGTPSPCKGDGRGGGPGELRGGGQEAATGFAVAIIPCCYDPAVAEDIEEAAAALGLSASELAARHAAADYRAYMYGFAPGWCYLGGLPERLAIPRRLTPRGPTPEGAVLIGGGLSLIATNPMPTGWYVIGRTPERLFSQRRDPPFLIAPGDALRFEPIDVATFAALDARAAAGETLIRREAPA